MDLEKKVLACVDQSHFADYVVDYSVWAAQRLAAPLELLHVLERHPEIAAHADHSGTLGLDAQAQLLTTLTEEDESRSKTAREQGRRFLARLRSRAIHAGMEHTDVRQRHGALADTLAEQERDARLFVLGRRGEAAEHTQRDLGRSVEWVVRRLKRPILAVTEDFRPPQRALLAFDGSPMTRRGVNLIAKSPLLRGLPMDILVSGKGKGEGLRHLPWAQKTLEQAGYAVEALQIPGDPERVIAETVQTREADLLIMGAYGHSPLRSLIFGSKTSDLLRSATLPTLLLR
ncbi:MAG: universal stress protein, partial [Pseudomonadales bacterium]|jgi:nucleotide-binding universal stress UspA family protein